MATTTTVGNGVKIDLDGPSGKLWMEGAGTALRLKRARHAYSFTRKKHGAKDARTIQYKAELETAKAAAENAERAWAEYVRQQA